MKIALLFDGLGLGGIERVGLDYIKILKSLDHKVIVYNLNPKQNQMYDEIKKYADIVEFEFSKFICPELYIFGLKKWWWAKFIYPILFIVLKLIIKFYKLLSLKKRKKVDLGIAFSGHINDLTFLTEQMIKTNKKVAWLHGSLAEYLLISPGFSNLYLNINNLCVLSNYAEEIAVNGNKFLKNLKIMKMNNPTSINEKKLDYKKINQLNEKYGEFMLCVGRFTKQKDQKTIIKAYEIMKNKYNIQNKLLFIGDGPTKNELYKYCKKKKLDQEIIFLGNKMDVENYYKAANIFLHSSEFEGFGMVIIEAMTFGTPVVATRSIPGVPEIIQDNKYGVMCNVKDPEHMADCCLKMLNDEILYNKYVNMGIKRARCFTNKQIKSEVEIFLNTIIKENKS